MHTLCLDYDGLPRAEVEADAKRLGETYNLGRHVVTPSRTTGHFHVEFPTKLFNNFEEAYQIALDSKADRDWLDLCKTEQNFTLASASSYIPLTERRQVTKPVKKGESPIQLIVVPGSGEDEKRIVGLCQNMRDETWVWRETLSLTTPIRAQIIIGCQDGFQANRRIRFMQKITPPINFTFEIKP